MGVDEDEEVRRSVSRVFVVHVRWHAGTCRTWLSNLRDELSWRLIEADYGLIGCGLFGIEVENVLHSGDVLGVHGGHAPHLSLPGFEVIFGEPSPHGFAGNLVVLGQAYALSCK
jgi:hypothetical protein